MRVNANFSKFALVVPCENDWVRSPESGVERLMLDRIGDEVARATSIVRYAQGSSFSRHEHAKGEEFLVLEGIFSDEHADYVAGTYVRNPPGSGHAPFSKDGCRILVKLRQFHADDLEQLVIDTNNADHWETYAQSNAEILHLHSFKSENVQMVRLQAGGRLRGFLAGSGDLPSRRPERRLADGNQRDHRLRCSVEDGCQLAPASGG